MSIWSWVLDAGGLLCTYFVGRKWWWGWLVWQCVNALWVVYALFTRQWGFLPGCAVYLVLNHRNMTAWRSEAKPKPKCNHQPVHIMLYEDHWECKCGK